MNIFGHNSPKPTQVIAHYNNGHQAVYECKALDCAALCKMLESECGKGLLRNYSVLVKYSSRMEVFCNAGPSYFGFIDSYPNWVCYQGVRGELYDS